VHQFVLGHVGFERDEDRVHLRFHHAAGSVDRHRGNVEHTPVQLPVSSHCGSRLPRHRALIHHRPPCPCRPVHGRHACPLPWHSLRRGCASSTTSRLKKSSCAGAQRAGSAQGTIPRGLHDSAAVIGGFSHQPDALMCHLRRAHPARLAAESLSNMMEERRWPAVMTPRDGGPQAAEGVASHSAADGARPSIRALGPMLATPAGELRPGFLRLRPRCVSIPRLTSPL
jgi:hypothetical protein